MKKMMIMGGMVGFLIGLTFGLVQGVTWPVLFLRASVATLVSGILLRWWGRLWVSSLQDSYQQRLEGDPDVSVSAPRNAHK